MNLLTELQNNDWYEEEKSDSYDDEYSFKEYDITASPNDFNVLTMYSFIESKVFEIPGFQRNYVWDIRRASKLIESIIIGLPIPQIFLYEKSKNNFLVIDGQQRLMTIYYFIKKHFPIKEKRTELRKIFDEKRKIPDEILHDKAYFIDFDLKLPVNLPDNVNKLNGLNYATLGDYKTDFELKTIRNVIIKQNSPNDDDSCIYEIFNRLNSGGVNLTPQEFRASLYHSDFYDMLYKVNLLPNWRKLLNKETPDLHMKDVEYLLRGSAMLKEGENYRPSMTRFLNKFSKDIKKMKKDKIEFFEKLFSEFIDKMLQIDEKIFLSKNNKFNITFFESILFAICSDNIKNLSFGMKETTLSKIYNLKQDNDFITACQSETASKRNVAARLDIAKKILIN